MDEGYRPKLMSNGFTNSFSEANADDKTESAQNEPQSANLAHYCIQA